MISIPKFIGACSRESDIPNKRLLALYRRGSDILAIRGPDSMWTHRHDKHLFWLDYGAKAKRVPPQHIIEGPAKYDGPTQTLWGYTIKNAANTGWGFWFVPVDLNSPAVVACGRFRAEWSPKLQKWVVV